MKDLQKRWKYVDPWLRECPYCRSITQYPDDVCDDCEKNVLPCKIKQAEG